MLYYCVISVINMVLSHDCVITVIISNLCDCVISVINMMLLYDCVITVIIRNLCDCVISVINRQQYDSVINVINMKC